VPRAAPARRCSAGLHIVGPRYNDALVLRAARAFETARPIALPDLARLGKKK